MTENINLVKIKQHKIKFLVYISKFLNENFELKSDIVDIFLICSLNLANNIQVQRVIGKILVMPITH